MSRIVFISPYRDLSALGQKIAAEMGMDNVEFYDGWMEEAVEVFEKISGPPADVLISRGGTAECLADKFNIPMVRVNTGSYDIIECLDEARVHSGSIIITSFGTPYVGMKLFEKVMGITIIELVFTSLADLERKIAHFSETGPYCVVGGGPSMSFARKYGLSGVFLRTSEETIRDAFLRASDLAKLQWEEKRKANRLKAILDCIYDGIIAIDSTGKVEIYNNSAARVMGIEASQILGKQVEEVIPNTRLDEILHTGKTELGEFQDMGDIRIVTNRIPIKDGAEILGAVATFQELSRVVQAERRMRSELTKHSQFKAKFSLNDIIGMSAVMKEKKEMAKNFASSNLTVLIYGPSGTGKELFAQSIHRASPRANQPFVAINCGALPPTLLESELFGYEEGAFTGARRKGKHGLFELAHNGTIFLDEIDALPFEMQGRLLRVLQEKEVLRVGGETIIPVNIRVIAATNKPPRELLRSKIVREDLFYRLNVLYLELPALSARSEDIACLCKHFLPVQEQAKLMPVLEKMLPYLEKYSWPGNVRELYNFVQRLAFFHGSYTAGKSMIELLEGIAPNILEESNTTNQESVLHDRMALQEEQLIIDAVRKTATIEEAVSLLGIGRSTLWRKVKKLRDSGKL